MIKELIKYIKVIGAIVGAILGALTLIWVVYAMRIIGLREDIVYTVAFKVLIIYAVLGYLGECFTEKSRKFVEKCYRVVTTVALAGCYTVLTHLAVKGIGAEDGMILIICASSAIISAVINYMLWGLIDGAWETDKKP